MASEMVDIVANRMLRRPAGLSSVVTDPVRRVCRMVWVANMVVIGNLGDWGGS